MITKLLPQFRTAIVTDQHRFFRGPFTISRLLSFVKFVIDFVSDEMEVHVDHTVLTKLAGRGVYDDGGSLVTYRDAVIRLSFMAAFLLCKMCHPVP